MKFNVYYPQIVYIYLHTRSDYNIFTSLFIIHRHIYRFIICNLRNIVKIEKRVKNFVMGKNCKLQDVENRTCENINANTQETQKCAPNRARHPAALSPIATPHPTPGREKLSFGGGFPCDCLQQQQLLGSTTTLAKVNVAASLGQRCPLSGPPSRSFHRRFRPGRTMARTSNAASSAEKASSVPCALTMVQRL